MDWALTRQTKAKPMIPWPNQAMPSDVCWVLWRRYLKQCFSPTTSRSHQLNTNMKLQQPFGEWTTWSPYTAQQYYYAHSTNHVYALKDGLFHMYKVSTNRVTWFHATNQTRTSIPDDAILHTVQKFGSTIYCKGPLTVAQEAVAAGMMEVTLTNGTFEEYIAAQPDHVKRILGNLQVAEVNAEYWIDALNKGLVTIATDGSVANQKGYYATILHTDQKQLRFQGQCNGAKSLMTSYWTKLAGILAVLYLL
eukprot:3326131-Ditylum_brightwellii.AAC.1